MLPATKDSFARDLDILVRKFDSDADTYRSAGYPEAQARNHFINPFFNATLTPDRERAYIGEAFHFLYTNYLKNIDVLWELSPYRVAANSLDQFLKRDKQSVKYRVPVDKRFLDDLSEWRLELARSIHANTPKLQASLIEIVQRLLDRIVFIRIAEDRKVIEPRQLHEVVEVWEAHGGRVPIMNGLVELFRNINDEFNGEIFKPHECEQV